MDLKSSTREEYDRQVAPVRIPCQFISIWPLDLDDVNGDVMKLKKGRKLQNYHRVFIFVYMLLLFIAQIAGVVNTWGNLEEFAEATGEAASCILTVFRLSFFTIQQKNIYFILEKMRSDWDYSSDEDIAILRKKCGPAFSMAKYFVLCVTLAMSLTFISPVLTILFTDSDERTLPYGGYFYIDITKTPIYQILYLVKVIGGIYGLCNVAAVNGFNLISVMHASAKFLILQNHLSALKSDDTRSEELLRLYIQEHQQAIEFADILEEIINKVALGQFLISTGLVCFAGLVLTGVTDNNMLLVISSVYLAAAIFELFIFSYSGYQLSFESESVGDSAFYSSWVGSSFTQDLNIVMMRSTKPNKITAAKFYDMSLESFTTVLGTSFSYFTTLRAMKE